MPANKRDGIDNSDVVNRFWWVNFGADAPKFTHLKIVTTSEHDAPNVLLADSLNRIEQPWMGRWNSM